MLISPTALCRTLVWVNVKYECFKLTGEFVPATGHKTSHLTICQHREPLTASLCQTIRRQEKLHQTNKQTLPKSPKCHFRLEAG